jgi:uncharacterized protein
MFDIMVNSGYTHDGTALQALLGLLNSQLYERMSMMKALHTLTRILVLVGAVNWGLVGFFAFDLVAALFGEMSSLSRIVYGLVGLSAVHQLLTWGAVSAPSGGQLQTNH